MPRWLQTLFMLREDQLIRWKKVGFWVCMAGALLLTLGTLTVYYMVNVRITKMVDWQLQTLADDSKILSMDSPKEKPLLLSCRMVGITLHSALQPLGVVWFLIAAFVPLCLTAGFYSLRLYELALEVQRLKAERTSSQDLP